MKGVSSGRVGDQVRRVSLEQGFFNLVRLAIALFW